MCVPCAAPALPGLGTLLLILLFILASIGSAIWRSLPVVGTILYWCTTGLYRWFSGATLTKPELTPEAELTQDRKYARHVVATLRTVGTASVILSLAYPLFFYGLSALLAGTAVGVGLNRVRIWRDNQLASRKADMVEQGEPIRVKAMIGHG